MALITSVLSAGSFADVMLEKQESIGKKKLDTAPEKIVHIKPNSNSSVHSKSQMGSQR